MKKVKNLANEIFIEGLSGMATGLFATLIIGTIIQQIGGLLPDTIGEMVFIIGKIAASVTGVGIGCGVAVRFSFQGLWHRAYSRIFVFAHSRKRGRGVAGGIR